MTLETWFWIAHAVALAGWLALVFVPAAGGLGVRIARWAAALLAVGYALLFFTAGPQGSELARNYSLEGVGAFFADPQLLLLGWVHYLAFDLFVGSWEAEEAHRLGISRRVLIACLILTFLLGPLGLLAFLAARSVPRRPASEQGENSIAS
ncbi:ABA4-like family protein [Allosphingosinicella sp.]|jgi:hypothetical protein|uniref:ABA4-like family protein n=1 Tax=Allosphingosinicella sp. TaxID=2823234 RepID=UPI002EEC8D8C